MKVKIGPFVSWYGPYQLAETLCFWTWGKKNQFGLPEKPDYVHKFGEFLAYGSIKPEPKVGEVYSIGSDKRKPTWINRFLHWIHTKKKRIIEVRIDRYDNINMDETLAFIIVPLLKSFIKEKSGGPYVDPKDVPEHLRPTEEPNEENGFIDNTHFKRWEWVLNEMLFAFESKLRDWESEFYEFDDNEPIMQFKKLSNGMSELVPGNFKSDFEGRKKVQERISNGFILFGKYYEGLWL